MKALWIILVFCVISLFAPKVFCQSDNTDAKDIFLAEKCQRCHSISSMNITNTGMKEASDLSAVGSDHNEEWLIKFLNREETVKGKKHLKNLKTEGTDIEKLAKWLATLKAK